MACQSAKSLLDAFDKVRLARKAKGTPTDHEQDLLRAALIFAAAGLDSMVKQLVRDSLIIIISKEEGARVQFADFVRGRLNRNETLDVKYLANALAAENMKQHLVNELIRELTNNSLQSKDQLLKVASHFAIPANEICSDLDGLKKVFDVRNQIAHEMDVNFGLINRSRRSRTFGDIQSYTATVLGIATSFYSAVAKRVN